MGRSVLTHPDSVVTLYYALPDLEEMRERRAEWDEDFAEAHWDDLEHDLYWVIKDVEHMLPEMLSMFWPSFDDDDRWLRQGVYDEVHVLSSNFAVEVSVSTYGGVMAVEVAHREVDHDYYDPSQEALARAWAERMGPIIADRIREFMPFDELHRLGRFSNGESVYEFAYDREEECAA